MTANGEIDFATLTTAAIAEKVAWVERMAGDRFPDLELQLLLLVVIITNHRRQAAAQLLQDIQNEPIANKDAMDIEELLESPYLLIGTVEQMAEQLLQRRQQLGISYISAFGDGVGPLSKVIERLAGM
jgi:alkanesulfonate monooxygenase SsuD/methylene tetrahydromethanopterin reductase-like flavin-dependent oxidoreductase (luciferase family)